MHSSRLSKQKDVPHEQRSRLPQKSMPTYAAALSARVRILTGFSGRRQRCRKNLLQLKRWFASEAWKTAVGAARIRPLRHAARGPQERLCVLWCLVKVSQAAQEVVSISQQQILVMPSFLAQVRHHHCQEVPQLQRHRLSVRLAPMVQLVWSTGHLYRAHLLPHSVQAVHISRRI